MNPEQVKEFLQRFTLWAKSRPDILAVAVVGSYARSQARSHSDLDLVLVCERPGEYLAQPHWILELGRVAGRRFEDYGKLTSLRVWYEDGLEVEYGIAGEEWAALPLDEGTRRVIADGMLVLYEQRELLSRHQGAQAPGRVSGPS